MHPADLLMQPLAINRVEYSVEIINILKIIQAIFLSLAQKFFIDQIKNNIVKLKILYFSDNAFFYRCFKRRFGVTPKEYRRNLLNTMRN